MGVLSLLDESLRLVFLEGLRSPASMSFSSNLLPVLILEREPESISWPSWEGATSESSFIEVFAVLPRRSTGLGVSRPRNSCTECQISQQLFRAFIQYQNDYLPYVLCFFLIRLKLPYIYSLQCLDKYMLRFKIKLTI